MLFIAAAENEGIHHDLHHRLFALNQLTHDMVRVAVAPGTHANHKTREKRYLEFCYWFNFEPYPLDEWQLMLFATYLSLTMQSADTIKQYCGTICELHEMCGYKPVRRGPRYQRTIMGIRRTLQHEILQAKPITIDMLRRIAPLVDVNNQKQLAIWVSVLTGFFLFLRKSNLVAEQKIHDPHHQLSRADIKFDEPVMSFIIKWSKTNQNGEKFELPIVQDMNSSICLVSWILFMVERIPAGPHHNLFSYWQNEHIYPVTYKDLTDQLRAWIVEIGENDPELYSSHSLRRGGTTHAFSRGVPEQTIKVLGNWASECFRKYIDITVECRLTAWNLISN